MEEDQDGGVGGCGVHIPDKYIKNTSTCRKIHIENQLKAGRRPLTQPKLQKRSPFNRVGWWREAISTGLTPLGGIWRRGAHAGEPSPWGAPLPAGRSAGTEGGVGEPGLPLRCAHAGFLAIKQKLLTIRPLLFKLFTEHQILFIQNVCDSFLFFTDC